MTVGAFSEVHDGNRAGGSEGILPVDNDWRAIGIVRKILARGWATAFIAHIGILAPKDHTIRRIANGDLGNELCRKSGQVQHAQGVRRVQHDLSAFSVLRECDATRINGFGIVILTSVGRRRR